MKEGREFFKRLKRNKKLNENKTLKRVSSKTKEKLESWKK